uniref:Uncharacterized protein n=1 Tax=Anopheles culicifacies TaxID=139723 RepID=A0A182M6Z3_9DIPT
MDIPCPVVGCAILMMWLMPPPQLTDPKALLEPAPTAPYCIETFSLSESSELAFCLDCERVGVLGTGGNATVCVLLLQLLLLLSSCSTPYSTSSYSSSVSSSSSPRAPSESSEIDFSRTRLLAIGAQIRAGRGSMLGSFVTSAVCSARWCSPLGSGFTGGAGGNGIEPGDGAKTDTLGASRSSILFICSLSSSSSVRASTAGGVEQVSLLPCRFGSVRGVGVKSSTSGKRKYVAVCTVNECIERGENPNRAAAIDSAPDSGPPLTLPPHSVAPFVGVALLSVVAADVDSDEAEEGVYSWKCSILSRSLFALAVVSIAVDPIDALMFTVATGNGTLMAGSRLFAFGERCRLSDRFKCCSTRRRPLSAPFTAIQVVGTGFTSALASSNTIGGDGGLLHIVRGQWYIVLIDSLFPEQVQFRPQTQH